MPVAPTYPGVYIEEVPSGVRTITGVATSITAFLGRTPRGPVNGAVVITSFGDFERTFGGLAANYPLTYAVRDFYQNGGSTAVIVRLFSPADGSGAAEITVGDLKIKATSPGSWGGKLRVAVELVTDAEAKASMGLAPEDALFNLLVRDTKPGGATERIMNLAVPTKANRDKNIVRRADKALGQESSLVRWRGDAKPGGGTTDAWPADKDTWPDPANIKDAASDTASTNETEIANAEKALADAKNALGSDPVKAKAYADAQVALQTAQAKLAAAKAATPPGDVTAAEAEVKTASDAVAAARKPVTDAEAAVTAAKNKLATAEAAMKGADSAALDQVAYIGDANNKTGMNALATTDLFNLLCIPPDVPGGDTLPAVYQAALTFCSEHRAMLVVDSPAAWSANRETAAAKAVAGLTDLGLSGVAARNAALYFPRVRIPDPLRGGRIETFVPCGIIAGVMARTDTQRGVWKAPAGLDAALSGISGLDAPLNDQENGQLNPLGINVLRSFPVYGNVVWGARTMRGADQIADEYKYIPVRRLALYIEESLFRGTKWVVFEPNDEPLWAQIRLNVGAFMHNLFRQGAFQGTTPKDAYFVKCDKETTTQNDINLGIVNIVVGFAPLKPAEFVIIKLQQIAGKIDV
ncbi:MAG: phage tail sheath subtilisin-like domain-containing protein [Gemmatimonadales bacterium]